LNGVALFSHYAPSEGFGGPSRIFHSRRVLEQAGLEVVHVVIQPTTDRGAARRHDIVALVERPYRAAFDHIYHDVELGRQAAADRRLVDDIAARLAERQVAAIILEQPFLVDVVRSVADRLHVPVVYSCQNIEYRLRRDLERFQPDWRRPLGRADEVRALEQAAVDLAASVTTIAETDRQMLQDEFGVDSTVVPNGTLVAELPFARHDRTDVDFAFAGSAYWPNIQGFAEIASPSLAFLPPTARVHVVGAVSNSLLAHPLIARHHSVNAARMVLHGFLPMAELLHVMASARAVLVPVFVGEGSNLKSADALACGSPVIMTRRATRGYEEVIDADPTGVTVVDDARQFRHAMSAALNGDTLDQLPVGIARHRSLTWSARLQPLVSVVGAAIAGRQAP
jgi:glycosyltransferase involved in cell wall biosynthesis